MTQNNTQYRRVFDYCPRCRSALIPAVSISGLPSEYWLMCSNSSCNTYVNTYVPQDHQRAFHEDGHLLTGNFGGYGSGKTLTSREEFYKHLFLTPNGSTLIGANVSSQYEQTIKKDIENDLPAEFVKASSALKAYYDFKNGHRVLFRPFDDVNKLRSYNLTSFVIVEASECKPEVLTQLKTRLRNTAAGLQALNQDGNPVFKYTVNHQAIPVMEADWRRGIIESNPDSGFIRTDVVMVADQIYKHGEVNDLFKQLEDSKDPQISAHISTSAVNEYLPANFIATNSKGKSTWWIQKYLFGSFQYAAGLIYPNVINYVVGDADIPKHWRRVVAFDYGLADLSVFLFAAIDEENSKVVFYKEIATNDKSIAELAKLYFEGIKDIPSGGMFTAPIIDPKSGPQRDYNKKNLSDHFLDYGIAFQSGAINKDARIFRANTYIELGYVRIHQSCTTLINELRDYKFKTDRSDENVLTSKPKDGNDHAISAFEWILMKLPANPKDLIYGVYNKQGQDLTKTESEKREQEYANWIFQDEEDQIKEGGYY